MDTKITPKIYAPGLKFVSTIERDGSYYLAIFVGQLVNGVASNRVTDRGDVPYGTRHEAAVQAQIWAKNIHLPYEPAGTDV